MKRFIEATAAMLAWAAGILAVRYCENPWLVAAGVLTNYCASVLRWKYLEMPEYIVTVLEDNTKSERPKKEGK